MKNDSSIEKLEHVLKVIRAVINSLSEDLERPEYNKLFVNYILRALHDIDIDYFDDIQYLEEFSHKNDYDAAYSCAESIIHQINVELSYLSAINDGKNEIYLDEEWRSRVQSYLDHIRELVRRAPIQERIKENINSMIVNLSQEVEKNRTKIERFSEMWLKITEAIGQGAENLEPAAKLVERLIKALSLRKEAQEPIALPSPDQAKLPPPDNSEVNE
ncbi:MAG: hypothetical protein O3A96_10740 [Proteobacteria bacterium]|nr:hypothetical protein [Pseudomonadota bacterium]